MLSRRSPSPRTDSAGFNQFRPNPGQRLLACARQYGKEVRILHHHHPNVRPTPVRPAVAVQPTAPPHCPESPSSSHRRRTASAGCRAAPLHLRRPPPAPLRWRPSPPDRRAPPGDRHAIRTNGFDERAAADGCETFSECWRHGPPQAAWVRRINVGGLSV